ncbi:MAG: biopolymer transporter ExbD [Planctomycetota bacterium]
MKAPAMNPPARRSHGMKGVAPFLDLLFLLLFGLLALSDSKKATDSETVRIALPKVEPGAGSPDAAETKKIVLVVDADSRVYLQGREGPVNDPAALDAALSVVVGDAVPEEIAVEIRGDADARNGVMVALLQHLRRRGFAAVSLLALGEENVAWGGE